MKIEPNILSINKVLKQLDPKGQQIVLRRSINKTSAKAKTAAKKSIRNEYRIKSRDVDIKLDKAKGNRFFALLRAAYKPLRLTKFLVKNLKKGLFVEIKKGSRKKLQNAFIGQPSGKDWGIFGQQRQVTSDQKLLFQRSETSGKYKGYPLKVPVGPSLGAMLKNESTKEAVSKSVDENFHRIFAHELEYRMSKKG